MFLLSPMCQPNKHNIKINIIAQSEMKYGGKTAHNKINKNS